MKVLQITAFSGWGCTGRIAQGICETLQENGDEAAIAWGRTNTAPDTIKTIQIGNHIDQLIHGLYTRLTDRCGFGSRKVTRDFLRKIDDYNPDVIQLHIIHGYYINIEELFRYLSKKNIPVVWTFHDCWAFTGHCPYFDMAGCDKWMSGCGHCVQKHHHPKSILLDNSSLNYQMKKVLFTGIDRMVVVTPSMWLKKLVEKSFFGKYPVKMIHNGIDTTKFKPTFGAVKEKYHIPDKKVLLGVSSTWAEGKGMADFVALSQRITSDYQIVLVGLDEGQLQQLPKEIIGIVRTDRVEELAELYTLAYAFLNLTYEDNYPTTNLEAIACKTPVITYRTGGSIEIVEETGYGKIVPQGNLDELLQAIEEISAIQINEVPMSVLEQKEKFKEYAMLYHEICDEN